MKSSKGKMQLVIVGVTLIGAYLLLPEDSRWKRASTWQHMASPGALSQAHADLEQNCSACHTSVQGVDPVKCILCHASDQDLLQRQPTSFHANITSCKECHLEHRGVDERPTRMDHEAIADIGLAALDADTDSERSALHEYLRGWIGSEGKTPGRHVTRALKRCLPARHATQTRTFTLRSWERTAGQCHATSMWTLPEFSPPVAQVA